MSRGRHSRPSAHGGGLASFLALALAGGAVALATTHPTSTALRLCVAGVALVGAVGLVVTARMQRSTSRAQARTEERLRVLEQRSRDEAAELHRRVIDAVMREGELRSAVEMLSAQIALLRSSLDGLAIPVEAATAAAMAAVPEPYPATVTETPATVDIPLLQRVLAVQETLAEPAQAAQPPAGDLWLPPARPEREDVPAAAAAQPASLTAVSQTEVRSWVVRELQVGDDPEPVAALTMRILDLTTPPAGDDPAGNDLADSQATDPADDEPHAGPGIAWSTYARRPA